MPDRLRQQLDGALCILAALVRRGGELRVSLSETNTAIGDDEELHIIEELGELRISIRKRLGS